MRLRLRTALAICLCVGCGPDKPGADAPSPEADASLRIGHVMVETGHRFETAGRAAQAERWELARYQVHEILEMFEDDMTRALLPGACDDSVSDSMYANLVETQLPELRDAAEAEDRALFDERFATVSGSCNGCHTGCEVGFIQVTETPGEEVPRVRSENEPTPPVVEAEPNATP